MEGQCGWGALSYRTWDKVTAEAGRQGLRKPGRSVSGVQIWFSGLWTAWEVFGKGKGV